jgi:hypothetical protein
MGQGEGSGQFSVLGFQFSVFSSQFSVFSSQFSVFGFRFSVFGWQLAWMNHEMHEMHEREWPWLRVGESRQRE